MKLRAIIEYEIDQPYFNLEEGSVETQEYWLMRERLGSFQMQIININVEEVT